MAEGTANVQDLAVAKLLAVQFLDGHFSRFGVLERDESKSTALVFLDHHAVAGDGAVLFKHLLESFIVQLIAKVLHVHVGEQLGLLAELLLALLARDEAAHEDLLGVEQHSVDLLDRGVGRFLGFKVHKAVSLGVALLVLGHLAAENVSERGERIVHGLVVDVLVQVLDEDVSNAGLAQRRVTLGPHDADRTSLDQIKVHRVQSTLSVCWLLKVDVGITKGTTGDHVAAHSDRQNGTSRRELLEQHCLGDIGVQIANVKRRHLVVWASWVHNPVTRPEKELSLRAGTSRSKFYFALLVARDDRFR